MLENETLGERSKLIPRSPRTYQLEPTSKASGPWVAGRVSGAAVPNRSAAEAGAATIAAAQARDNRKRITLSCHRSASHKVSQYPGSMPFAGVKVSIDDA